MSQTNISPQVQARINKSKRIPKYNARRVAFRYWWRKFYLSDDVRRWPRRMRRRVALGMWRATKGEEND